MDKKASKQPPQSNKANQLIENVDIQPRRPKTQATNKLRLNFKVVSYPSIKNTLQQMYNNYGPEEIN